MVLETNSVHNHAATLLTSGGIRVQWGCKTAKVLNPLGVLRNTLWYNIVMVGSCSAIRCHAVRVAFCFVRQRECEVFRRFVIVSNHPRNYIA